VHLQVSPAQLAHFPNPQPGFDQQGDQGVIALGQAVPGLAGGAQQCLHFRRCQSRRTQARPQRQEPQIHRNIRLHLAAFSRPPEQLLQSLDLAVDGGCLQALDPYQVLAVVDEIDGRNACERNGAAHCALTLFDPLPEPIEIVPISARRDGREVVLLQAPREVPEQALLQDRPRLPY